MQDGARKEVKGNDVQEQVVTKEEWKHGRKGPWKGEWYSLRKDGKTISERLWVFSKDVDGRERMGELRWMFWELLETGMGSPVYACMVRAGVGKVKMIFSREHGSQDAYKATPPSNA